MKRATKIVIVAVAAIAGIPAAFASVIFATTLFWIFGLGMCDFSCGDTTSFPTAALWIVGIVYTLGLGLGIRWIIERK